MATASHFSPYAAARRPCWHCVNYRGLICAGSAARCGLPNSAAVRSMPADGCSGFEREVGADDVPDQVPDCNRLAGLPDRPGFVERVEPTPWAP